MSALVPMAVYIGLTHRCRQGSCCWQRCIGASRGRGQLSDLMRGLSYCASEVFNIGKTGLMYRAMSKNTLATDTVKGSKLEKE